MRAKEALDSYVGLTQPPASYPTSLEAAVDGLLARKFISSIQPNTGNDHVNAQTICTELFNFVNGSFILCDLFIETTLAQRSDFVLVE